MAKIIMFNVKGITCSDESTENYNLTLANCFGFQAR